ncbi:MAG TPA: hypothetical protein H9862_08705 [Candidatus Akkermansia intestinigallinarum]|uniref:Uncharacterized protein n=1 Tax=Candidatus Akkermansia intestinigallinarum TaxID=2838431 RepID=A0A9D2AIQ4_9BACT|nr:hypothetical protein [Candidatus Akkermansia intestinigallinarum]
MFNIGNVLEGTVVYGAFRMAIGVGFIDFLQGYGRACSSKQRYDLSWFMAFSFNIKKP